ncbi:dihydroorotase [Patescibacteria group bacterium]|nr:dihydroorotase [Patescibacteria group bacterium]MCL5010300.1 dihydroorotase [Patescibacteria group bacterium]
MAIIKLPGLIDLHVHLRDPGQTNKEDFYTGTCAALAGGYTAIIDMPNNKIPITASRKLEEKIKIAKRKTVCDLGFYFGSMGRNIDEFEKVKDKVFGLKLYLNETTGNFLIKKADLEKIFKSWKSLQTLSLHSDRVYSQKPILLHAEDSAVDYVISLVKKTGAKAHFCHISTASDLKQIIKAKENNLPVTCGVTPHHLFLTEEDVRTLGPFGQMKPPLRSKKDQNFIWKNLKYVDVVESDHAPHTIKEKRKDPPPFGVPGLETTLPFLLTAVSQKRLTVAEVIRLCHTNPGRILGIKSDKQTYSEVDLNCEFLIRNSNLHTKCGWSPFAGWKIKGKVNKVFIRGKKVFEYGKVLTKPGFGNIIKP